MNNRCGRCSSFRPLPTDPPTFLCENPDAKTLIPRIDWLQGPAASACKFFSPKSGEENGGELSLKDKFLEAKHLFVNVKEAVHLLDLKKSVIYDLVATGELRAVRVRRRIYIYKPSIPDQISVYGDRRPPP